VDNIEAYRRHSDTGTSSDSSSSGGVSQLKMNESELRKAWEGEMPLSPLQLTAHCALLIFAETCLFPSLEPLHERRLARLDAPLLRGIASSITIPCAALVFVDGPGDALPANAAVLSQVSCLTRCTDGTAHHIRFTHLWRASCSTLALSPAGQSSTSSTRSVAFSRRGCKREMGFSLIFLFSNCWVGLTS